VPNWRKISSLPPEQRVPIYRAHLERKPKDAAIWFDLGLAHKFLREWAECADANERALALSHRRADPAWWNLGIAATALRRWSVARRAWRGYGLDGILDGDDPIDADYGSTPVRLPSGEVVWGKRIDPARVKIANIPFVESGFRWGDIVLHDGQPNGERVWDGRTYSVFDVLERWSPSEIPTLVADAECDSDDDALEIVELFEANHFAAEDWSTNVRALCPACSAGSPGEHSHSTSRSGYGHTFGIACPMGLATRLMETWTAVSPHSRRYEWVAPSDRA